MISLERRLQTGLAGSLVVLLGLLGWLLSLTIENALEEVVLSRLQHDGENLLTSIQTSESGISLPTERVNDIYQRAFSGHYYLILSDEGIALRSRSLWDSPLTASALPAGEVQSWRGPGPNGQTLLFWAAGYEKGGMHMTIVLGEDMTALLSELNRYRWIFAGMTIFILLFLLAIQGMVVRSSFSNLRNMKNAVDRLESGAINQLPEDVPAEVLPLVRETNRLLTLMGQRLQRSRNAVGNLAHALKGPLNLLIQLSAQPCNDKLQGELKQQTERMQQLVEHELRRARLAGSATPGQRFKPAEELPALITLLQRIYPDKTLDYDLQIDSGLVIQADRDDMLELLGNLLDNAAKWARRTVHCTISGQDGILISIEDDGPGCTEAEIEAMVARGTRLDEQKPGHGLGLAIVKDIVGLYGAELLMDRSPELQGLRVRIQIGG